MRTKDPIYRDKYISWIVIDMMQSSSLCYDELAKSLNVNTKYFGRKIRTNSFNCKQFLSIASKCGFEVIFSKYDDDTTTWYVFNDVSQMAKTINDMRRSSGLLIDELVGGLCLSRCKYNNKCHRNSFSMKELILLVYMCGFQMELVKGTYSTLVTPHDLFTDADEASYYYAYRRKLHTIIQARKDITVMAFKENKKRGRKMEEKI